MNGNTISVFVLTVTCKTWDFKYIRTQNTQFLGVLLPKQPPYFLYISVPKDSEQIERVSYFN